MIKTVVKVTTVAIVIVIHSGGSNRATMSVVTVLGVVVVEKEEVEVLVAISYIKPLSTNVPIM